MKVMTPTNLRKSLFETLKGVATDNNKIEISLANKDEANDGVVMLSKREWRAIQEELYLYRTGTLGNVLSLMESESDDDFEKA
ncbi:type II toxin-antitoxin system Phd/YefM family antitoxin [Enterococcus gilvus]|uniref:Prevent-host-death family protein n=1 Tax=Enterococcus gilvus ATCC BAA-350 TaxID=1158614 RepID=R2XUG6_9ENTE|nr:hypothetical protein [Enterococcus gilvus]EOI58203.1 hypothetical protein UKC_00275 [Enterococcus gilvus ATCC BAA-350]EOW79035.1 hypothetical protein I592_03173 [Enterococcus gilvus ATCC BAA-350]OJG43905.1 hypothetical protein RV02_GL002289 [Enterococcus gilvus]